MCRKALETLAMALPPLIEAYQRLVGLPTFGPARVATLSFLRDLLPVASFALAPKYHRGRSSASWHAAAGIIGAEAKEAWESTGRTKFGCNPTSPLVHFVQEFLARAGIEKGCRNRRQGAAGKVDAENNPQLRKRSGGLFHPGALPSSRNVRDSRGAEEMTKKMTPRLKELFDACTADAIDALLHTSR